MARPLRIEYPGAYYHVMNRGQSRRNIFIENKGRQTFLDLLADMAQLWKVKIYAYCLMDNHYHLLLSTPKGGLSRPMRHLDGIYTQKFNRLQSPVGKLVSALWVRLLDDQALSGHSIRALCRRHHLPLCK
jgi:REP-associated tyrosine transposase